MAARHDGSMSSITQSHAVHTRVTAPLRAVPLAVPVQGVVEEDPAPVEVAERVRASAHVAAGAAGVDLSATPAPASSGDATDTGSGLRFLGAGWAADAALFAQYRRRGV